MAAGIEIRNKVGSKQEFEIRTFPRMLCPIRVAVVEDGEAAGLSVSLHLFSRCGVAQYCSFHDHTKSLQLSALVPVHEK